MANNQPIIFDLKYTPYSLSKKASDYERNKNATERAFYDMSGEKNVYVEYARRFLQIFERRKLIADALAFRRDVGRSGRNESEGESKQGQHLARLYIASRRCS